MFADMDCILTSSDKFAAERASWEAESRALLRAREAEALAGNRQKRVLDLDVGYHKELENANKRLEMDNRLMAPRVSQPMEAKCADLSLSIHSSRSNRLSTSCVTCAPWSS
jgi:hypothetical protein